MKIDLLIENLLLLICIVSYYEEYLEDKLIKKICVII